MTKQKMDCGVLIALREEFEGKPGFPSFGNFFDVTNGGEHLFFSFTDSSGVRRIGVIAIMHTMTPLEAYQVTRNLIERYTPAIMINVGIAGSLSKNLGLGDVVVANFADQYDFRGKAVASDSGAEGFKIQWGGHSYSATEELYTRIQQCWSRLPNQHKEWQERCASQVRTHLTPETVNKLMHQGLINEQVKIESGPLASGNTVGASKAFRDSVLEHNRTLVAVEMESAGFLKACIEKSENYPRVVLKGISDPADENKEMLDVSTGYGIRAWAMGNVLDLLSVVCRREFEYNKQPPDIPKMERPIPSLADLREELLLLAAEKHFKKQHKHLPDSIDKALGQYDSLFSRIIQETEYLGEGKNVFLNVAEQIIDSRNPYPLQINGKPGTGKTTFLTLLYLALYKLSKTTSIGAIPIYLNLRRYTTPQRGKENNWNPRLAMEDDIAFIEKVLTPDDSRAVVVLIDGIDEYIRHDENVEEAILALVGRSPYAKKVVGVGLNYLADKERFRRDLSHLNNPERVLTLDALSTGNEQLMSAFVGAFGSVCCEEFTAEEARLIIDAVGRFQLRAIDLLLVSMLANYVRSGKIVQIKSLSELFTRHCDEFLRAEGSSETLSDAARLAFEYTVKSDPIPLDRIVRRRGWKLLNSHPAIKDFLVAFHAVRVVRAAGKPAPNQQLTDLNYVYPHSVNRFSKDLANSTVETQFDVLEGAKWIFQGGGENGKPHACYLVGRLTDHDARVEAAKWLRSCRTQLEELQQAKGSNLTRSELLLCRTVYISLAYLGDEEASEAYIRLLIDHEDWNDINRGFHLEYYNDIPFDPDRLLSHSDRLGPFSATYESLFHRLSENLENPDYGLFNIEVFTLYSLAQYRHARLGRLDQNIREKLLAFIPVLLKCEHLSRTLSYYLKMLSEHLKFGYFAQGRLIEKLYGLKREPRAGWIERQLPLGRVESVADHIMGAYLLALIYLPEGNPEKWRGYNKAIVLAMLLVHDLPEAFTGDTTVRMVTSATKQLEREAFIYLSMCKTYSNISQVDQYYELWEEFESGANENAKIARDVDKLENLVQLYLYQKEIPIPDFLTWKSDLVNSLSSAAGKRILIIIREHFEPSATR